MSTSYWIDTELGEWTPTIAGLPIPGVVSVDLKSSSDIDVKKAKGQDKATTENNGQQPAKVTISITLANRRHWLDWQAFLPRLKPVSAGSKASPLAIVHPDCELHGVRTIIVEEIDDSAPTARGGKTISIKCTEWIPAPKPAAVSPKPKVTAASLGRSASNLWDAYTTPIVSSIDTVVDRTLTSVAGWFS